MLVKTNKWELHEKERIDDLVRDGMRIIQRTDQFCFSLDSILLAHYVQIKAKERIVDLGTGTGVISLLLSALGAKDITALEINPIMVELAKRNVIANGKRPVVVPRRKKFGEHVNDHQLDFCNRIVQEGYDLVVVEDIKKIREYLNPSSSIAVKSNNECFVQHFSNLIAELVE